MIRTTLRVALATALAAALAPPVLAQEAAVTRRAVELRDTPADKGAVVAALPAQAPLTRLQERRGPWVQVRTAEGATGWVHLFDIGPAAAAGEGSGAGGALRGLSGLFGGSRPTQTGSTAGIRGLEAQDIANATPNPAAVRQMEGLRQDEAQVRAFADRAALRPVPVEPLPAPARSAAPAGATPGNPGSAP